MNGLRLPRLGRIAAAGFLVTVLLCWPAGPVRFARAASGRAGTGALLTAQTLRAKPGCDPEASLRPPGPPVVTPGSFMAKIRARGYLIAGVDQNTYHFGYLNPFDGQIEGFDIDMLHAVAAAIFGNPDKIRFVAISDAQRIPFLQSGRVDIVAHTMTITCPRWRQVDFSTVYFDAHQRVLVRSDSTVRSVADLGGKKVCATTGSTSLATIRAAYAKAGMSGPHPGWRPWRTGLIAWCCCSRARSPLSPRMTRFWRA